MNKPNSGIIEIHGKQYETVALRVKKFREAHGFDLSLTTDIIHRDESCVVMRATIRQGETILATGHAEEYRENAGINRTSALENCETSAIGRALATLGLGGTEFATADELKRAIVDKKGAYRAPNQQMMADYLESLPIEKRETMRRAAADIESLIEEGRAVDARSFVESMMAEAREADRKNDTDTELTLRMALWGLLGSKARSAIKAASQQTAGAH